MPNAHQRVGGGWGYFMGWRLLDALVLTFRNFAPFKKSLKTKHQWMSRDMFIVPDCMPYRHGSWPVFGVIYIHIGVGYALLVSTTWAMRRSRKVRRVTGTGSHA